MTVSRAAEPTLYHYVRHKEQLLVLIYSDVLDESLRMARETVAAAPTPLDAVRDLIISRVVYACENQDLLKICFEEEDELRPDLAEALLERRRAFEDVFTAEVLAHLAAHPGHRLTMTPRVYVNMCLGAVNWTYKWYSGHGARNRWSSAGTWPTRCCSPCYRRIDTGGAGRSPRDGHRCCPSDENAHLAAIIRPPGGLGTPANARAAPCRPKR